MSPEYYKDQLMECLWKMYPQGSLPAEVNALEFTMQGTQHTFQFDRKDYEQYRSVEPRTFGRRLTRADKALLRDMKVTT